MWEWVESIPPPPGVGRGLRGGSFGNRFITDVDDLHAEFRWMMYSSISEGRDVGFRLALVPEPGTIVLLALAGMAIVGGRKGYAGHGPIPRTR